MMVSNVLRAIVKDAPVKSKQASGNYQDLKPRMADQTTALYLRAGLSIPNDWHQFENRLEFAVALSKQQAGRGADIKGFSFLEGLIEPLRQKQEDARLVGCALGYGFVTEAKASHSDFDPASINYHGDGFRFLIPGILSA